MRGTLSDTLFGSMLWITGLGLFVTSNGSVAVRLIGGAIMLFGIAIATGMGPAGED